MAVAAAKRLIKPDVIDAAALDEAVAFLAASMSVEVVHLSSPPS